MLFIFLFMISLVGIYMAYEDLIRNILSNKWLNTAIDNRKKELELFIVKNNKTRIDKELFNSSIILKNLSLVTQQSPFSADYMYEKLMENSTFLKPVYRQMLTVYRSRESQNAFKVLPLTLNTKTSKNFAIILSKLERISPVELAKQMDVFQKNMMDQRMTYAIKRVQKSSMVLTVLSTITVFAILLNFVVVVVFLDTIQALNQLFI